MRRKKRKQTCHWCARPLNKSTDSSNLAFTMDHVWPKSMGGYRKVPCCIACNQIKANKTLAEWQMFMLNNPEWWKLYRRYARTG